MLGQPFPQRGFGRRLVDRGGAGDVADEPGLPGGAAGHHRGGGHPGQGAQRRLDLPRFDPEAPHLHLLVDPPAVGQVLPGPAHLVPGAVHAGAGRAERVGQEPLGGQAGPVEVPPGQARARHVQLTPHAVRHRPQVLVQHVHPGVADGAADGDRAGDRRSTGRQLEHHAAHGGLGGPVLVDDPRARVPVTPALQHRAVQRLAADDQVASVGRGVRQGLQQPQVARGDLEQVRARGVLAQVPETHPAARDQRGEQVGDGHVEGHRGMHQRLPRGRRVQLRRRTEVGRQGRVLDHHGLGPPGGTGGVDQVGGLARVRHQAQVVVGAVGHRKLGEHHPGPGVVDQQADPLGRVAGLDGQVGRSGLEHPEQRDHQVDRAGQHHGHHRPRADAARPQPPGKLVGPPVQLGVGQGTRVVQHRHRVRRAVHLSLEPLRQQDFRPLDRGRVALGQQPVLGRGEQVQFGQSRTRVGHGGGEQAFQVVQQAHHAVLVEQLGGVLQVQLDPARVRPFPEPEAGVEPGGAAGCGDRGHAQRAEPGLLGIARAGLEQRDLEQRVAAGVAVRAERAHHLVEGHVLVVVRAEHGLVRPGQQFPERGVALGGHAQHHRVGEEPDEALQFGAGAAAEDRAQRDVALPGVHRQHRGQARGEHRQHPGARPGGQVQQVAVQRGGQQVVEVAPGEGGLGGAGAVGRHGQGGQVRQALGPVPQSVHCGPAALPGGVVGVLHGQFRQLRLAAGLVRQVGLRQLAEQDRHGLAVDRDVVRAQHQEVVVLGGPGQAGAQHGVAGQVDRPGALGHREVHQRGQPVAGHPGQVGHRQRHQVRGGPGELARPVRGAEVAGAQDLVPAHDRGQRALEGGHVQRAAQPQGERGVVHGQPGGGAVQEPQAFLGEGQRQRPRARYPADAVVRHPAPAGVPHLGEQLRPLLRRERRQPSLQVLLGRHHRLAAPPAVPYSARSEPGPRTARRGVGVMTDRPGPGSACDGRQAREAGE